ncbi:MAG: META domain-containing protein [Cypionkella sp.]
MRRFVWAMVVMAAGCVQAAPVDWALARIDGVDPDYTATLAFVGARVVGQAPCNGYFAQATRSGDQITLGPIAGTRRACLQIKGEAAYFEALQGVTGVEETATTLTLSGAGHVLVFAKPQL